ncbi:unnamed protein product [Cochlearia groenlandica]
MRSLVERLRIRSDRKPVYNLDVSDDDDFLPKKDRTLEHVEAIVRTDAVLFTYMEVTENLQVSPLNEMDKILECEMRPTVSNEQGSSDAATKQYCEKQYLVKWKGLSYLHCTWVNNFQRIKLESANNNDDDFVAIRPEWTTVDRILSHRTRRGKDAGHRRNPRDFQQFDHTPEFLKGSSITLTSATPTIGTMFLIFGKTIQSIALLASLFEESLIPH